MRTKDNVLLEDAYDQVRVINETKFKNLVAAAAMGLSAAHGTPTDADSHELNPPIVQQAPKAEEPVSHYHIAEIAYKKAIKEKRADDTLLRAMAAVPDIAKDYARHLILIGQHVPDIIKRVIPQYTQELERAKSGAVD